MQSIGYEIENVNEDKTNENIDRNGASNQIVDVINDDCNQQHVYHIQYRKLQKTKIYQIHHYKIGKTIY